MNTVKLKIPFGALLFFLGLFSLPALENRIAYLEGDVSVIREDEILESDFGFILRDGDRIATGADSMAIIELKGNRTLKMKEETLLNLDRVSENTSLTLERGGLFSKVEKLTTGSFTVRAESVVAGIRGTEFFLSYGKTTGAAPDIWLCVNEGTVRVDLPEAGESVLVSEGEGITIPGGSRLTRPKPYSWTKDLNWNTDPGTGPVRDNTDPESFYKTNPNRGAF